MVKKLNCLKSRERGKELKVPHHTNTAAARDGNLPYIKATCLNLPQIMATCLYSQHQQLFFCGCHLYTTNAIKRNIIRHTHDTPLPISTDSASRDWAQDRNLPQSIAICRLCHILPSLPNPAKFCQDHYLNYYIFYSLLTQPLIYIYKVFISTNIFSTLFRFAFVIIFTRLF